MRVTAELISVAAISLAVTACDLSNPISVELQRFQQIKDNFYHLASRLLKGAHQMSTPIMAQAAAAFDQSIGVNVHMAYTSTPYGNVALVENSLAYLGINNVRDTLVDWLNVQPAYQQLGADGIKFDFLIPVYTPPGQPSWVNLPEFVSMVDAFATAHPGSVHAIEGPNEVNDVPATYDGGTTLADQAGLQQALYAAVRADSNLNGIPVYNLTLANTNRAQYAALGNLSSAANYANDHAYVASNTTPAAGLANLLPFAQLDASGLPTVITETGYNTDPNDSYSGVDQTVQAKYTLDTLLDAFKSGIPTTYLYELLDEGSDPTNSNPQLHYGLFNSDGTPKLAATAIHNLTTILVDPGSTSSFTPGSLNYSVSNLPASGNQLLLEKSNGTFDLVLWAESPLWNPSTQSEVVAPTKTSTVNFGQVENQVLVFDPLEGTAPIASYTNVQSIQVQLSDHPIIIEVPSGTGSLTTTQPSAASAAAVPPAAPVIMNDVVNGNSSVTLSGTAEANSTVIVYDGQTRRGTTIASAGGAWSYTTGSLASGAHVFTATVTDATGLTSTVSNTVGPNVGPFSGVQSGTLGVADGTTLGITGTINNTGTIALSAAGNGAKLAVVGNSTLTGSGSITLSNNAGNVIASNGTAATLTNTNNTISGAGTIGDSLLAFNNQGVVNANSSVALLVNTGGNQITNTGILEATSSGGLDINSDVNNSKTIEALGTNTKLVVAGVITNTSIGLILASGSGAQVDLNNATISGGKLQTLGRNAFIETASGTADTLNGGTITSGSVVEINSGSILTLSGTVTNSSTLLVNGGTLDVEGALTGGMTQINGAGKMVIALASSESVAFQAKSTGELILDQAPSYSGTITGFGTSQSIDLADINFSTGVRFSYASNNRKNTSGVLTITDGTSTTHLQFNGPYTLANFKVASDGAGGTLLTDPTVMMQRPGNASATIAGGTVLEVNTPDKGSVTFSGTTGTLWLDQPSTFTGKVSEFGAQNGIDLPAIAFGAQTTLGYSPNSNNTAGTLSLTDGAHSATIALLGSYMASSFVMASDNHGGTMVFADAAQSANQSLLTHPQHA